MVQVLPDAFKLGSASPSAIYKGATLLYAPESVGAPTTNTVTFTAANGTVPVGFSRLIANAGTAQITSNQLAMTGGTTAYAVGSSVFHTAETFTVKYDYIFDVAFDSAAEQYATIAHADAHPLTTNSIANGLTLGIGPTYGAELRQFVGGANTRISPDFSMGTWTANVAKRVRFVYDGTNVMWKYWDPAVAEPAAWAQTVAITSTVSGAFFISQGNGAGSTQRTLLLDTLVTTTPGTLTPSTNLFRIESVGKGINTSFNSPADLAYYPYTTGTITVASGAANSTITNANSINSLQADPQNLLGGSCTIQQVLVQGAPTGYTALWGFSIGENFEISFAYDGYGLTAQVRVYSAYTQYYIGQYLNASHGWQRIVIGSDSSIIFQVSTDGAVWTTPHSAGFFGTIPAPFSAMVLSPFWQQGAYQAITSTTAQLLSLVATGPHVDDRSHIVPAAANLIYVQDFAGTTVPAELTVDNTSWAVASNVTVSDGALHLKIAGGNGSRVYFFTPAIRRYGRYEWVVKLQQATGAGPAVFLWPYSDNWAEGEMDVFEGGTTQSNMTVHFFPAGDTSDHRQMSESLSDDTSVYTKFTWEWTPTLLRGWIGDRLVWYGYDPTGSTKIIPQTNFRIDMHHGFNDGYTVTGAETGSLDIDSISLYAIPGISITS